MQILPRMDDWSRGRAIRARQLNQPLQAIRDMVGGVMVPRGVLVDVGPASISIRQVKLVTEFGDYLDVDEWNGIETGIRIQVAKPPELRQTSFDGISHNGITYAYTNKSERVGTDDTTEDTETQVIVPPYVEGDILYVARGILGGVGVTVPAPGDTRRKLEWLDLSTGRAWAELEE